MSSRLQGVEGVQSRLEMLKASSWERLWNVLQYLALQLQSEMRTKAPWTDRTGNARRALQVIPDNSNAPSAYRLIFTSQIDYGIWLEIKNNGRYAIIWKTVTGNLTMMQQQWAEAMRPQ